MKERSSRIPEAIKGIQELILEDPGCSIWKMTTIVGVKGTIIRIIVKEDLRYHYYTIKIRQMVSEDVKMKQETRCHLSISLSLKNEAAGRIGFSPTKKSFTDNAKINRRNNRWFVRDPEDVPAVAKLNFRQCSRTKCQSDALSARQMCGVPHGHAIGWKVREQPRDRWESRTQRSRVESPKKSWIDSYCMLSCQNWFFRVILC